VASRQQRDQHAVHDFALTHIALEISARTSCIFPAKIQLLAQRVVALLTSIATIPS